MITRNPIKNDVFFLGHNGLYNTRATCRLHPSPKPFFPNGAMGVPLTESKAPNCRGGQAFRNDFTAPSDPLQSCGRHTDPRSETALLPPSPRATTSRGVVAGWLERRSFPESAGRAGEPPLPSRVVRRTDTKANGVTQNAARAYDEGRGERRCRDHSRHRRDRRGCAIGDAIPAGCPVMRSPAARKQQN